MKLFEKMKAMVKNGQYKRIYLFGIPILEIRKEGKHKKYIFVLLKKNGAIKCNSNDLIMYLKVNRTDDYSFWCLQEYINISNILKAKFIIICDNLRLEKMILKRIVFQDSHINFMRSYKKGYNKFIKSIASPFWEKAAYAHLTTFLHAQKYKITNFWNIDADDTMFMLHERKTVNILKQAMTIANALEIDVFSLDMHTSRTSNISWTFGITYTRMSSQMMSTIFSCKNNQWFSRYKQYYSIYNFDLYITYLRDEKKLKALCFYPNNIYFCHYAYISSPFMYYSIYYFDNGRLYLPISKVTNEKDINIKIPNDVIKIDIGTSEHEGKIFLDKKVLHADFAKLQYEKFI